jgi:hypothetical protein
MADLECRRLATVGDGSVQAGSLTVGRWPDDQVRDITIPITFPSDTGGGVPSVTLGLSSLDTDCNHNTR